jgi:NADH dehydrogenase/NADH:ubiquinone oxidoreductase subunit G
VEALDLTDSVGCNIFVAVKQTTIVRVLPKKKKTFASPFISDKARYSFDALTNLRLLKSF